MSSALAKYSQEVDRELYYNDISAKTAIDKEPLHKALQQMFSEPADPKDEGLRLSMHYGLRVVIEGI